MSTIRDFDTYTATGFSLARKVDVAKHGADVKQLGIELQILPQPNQGVEILDSGRIFRATRVDNSDQWLLIVIMDH
jgi:hypothetical protein